MTTAVPPSSGDHSEQYTDDMMITPPGDEPQQDHSPASAPPATHKSSSSPSSSSPTSSLTSSNSPTIANPGENDASSSTPGTALAHVSSTSSSSSRYSAPLSRRTHVKSRLGCFTCKRRRVKCNEVRPMCSSCRRLGLRCEYPIYSSPTVTSTSTLTTTLDTSSALSAVPFSAGDPQAPISMLTLVDLRFYHQFLTVGFPALPLKAESVWPQCAAMSHQYDFLAHALLGLGASHFSQNAPNGPDYQPQALQHRVTAIRRVNEKLSQPLASPADADALFAAIMCLLAQSSLLPGREGMWEYLSMGRGASLVNQTMVMGFDGALFAEFTMQKHMADLTAMVTEQPKDPALIAEFRASVGALAPLCARPYEVAYHENLTRAINALETSSLQAWKEFVTLFMMPTRMSNEDFATFIQADNYVAQLLMVHMFLVDYIIGRFGFAPDQAPKCEGRKNVVISWIRNVAQALPVDLKPYTEWVLRYCEVLERQDSRHLMTP